MPGKNYQGAGVVAPASFLPSAAAYSAGDIIAAAQELVFTFPDGDTVPPGSIVRVLSASLKIDQTGIISGETSYTLHLYSVTPPSAQADNDAWTLASADLASYRGSIGLGTPVDLGAACFVKTGALTEDLRLAGNSLFGRLVTVGGFTATAVARQVVLQGIVL
jgi:hypothetical protein